MGLTRADLTDPKNTDQDKKEIAVALNNYMQNDEWNYKPSLPLGILITSHPGNRAYLKACIESHKKLGYWIVLAYDNYIHPDHPKIDYNAIFPPKDVMENVDTFIMPHYQTWGGVLYPYFWLLKFGMNVMQDFEYTYCINGDMVIEKPEGFNQLLDLLGDADIMGTGPDIDEPNRYIFNTAGFIGKTKAIKAIMDHFEERLVPFENYEKYTQEVGNTEGRFGRAIKDLGLKKVVVDPPYNEQLHKSGQGTWYDLIGFRHIHAELNYAYRYKGIPPEAKYMDNRYAGQHDIKYLKMYEETKDPEVLKNWWAT
jgi:hypothetical protein